MSAETWVSISQAAEIVPYSARTIRAWAAAGTVASKPDGDARSDGKPARLLVALDDVRAEHRRKAETRAGSPDATGARALAERDVAGLLSRLDDRADQVADHRERAAIAESKVEHLTERLASLREDRDRLERQLDTMRSEWRRGLDDVTELRAELAAVKVALTRRQRRRLGYPETM